MDSIIKFKVLNAYSISGFEIIVELENVEFGLISKGVLKSIETENFWEIQNRVIEFQFEERFENEKEMETYSHVKLTDFNIDYSEIERIKSEKKIRTYILKPIGNNSKPVIGDFLVFHVTQFRKKVKIIEIYEDYFLLEEENGEKAVIPKRKVTRRAIAKIGDYVRHCEHQYHDLIDEDGNFIYRT